MSMELLSSGKDAKWWIVTLPAFLGSKNILDVHILFSLIVAAVVLSVIMWLFTPGGMAWANGRGRKGRRSIPGPRGLPIFGSLFTICRGLAHRSLAQMAWSQKNTELMSLSLGSNTSVVVASDPHTAREILTSPHFADRPIKMSARSLMFSRAIGFAPNGAYWRLLRRIASTHLFSPRRILASGNVRQEECLTMLHGLSSEQRGLGFVAIRQHLQLASLTSIMRTVFGKTYNQTSDKEKIDELQDMVAEGFDLLGAFNWSDYLPWMTWFYDPFKIQDRCAKLVPRVSKFVREIIHQHRDGSRGKLEDSDKDFVDVLLSLEGEEKLEDDDMVAVLWEMIFRGTDTTALLTEWIMAELILHQEVQDRLREEVGKAVAETGTLSDGVVMGLPYLSAVVKETLRVHPPGPLLSWARLSTSDVVLSNGMVIPANTTAMINMWAITHDCRVWEDPLKFKPDRFLETDIDIRGGDLRLAPFGAGRRVCPGKSLGLATVTLWVAHLVHRFKWLSDPAHPVDLSELLKLSCEMKHPLHAVVIDRES